MTDIDALIEKLNKTTPVDSGYAEKARAAATALRAQQEEIARLTTANNWLESIRTEIVPALTQRAERAAAERDTAVSTFAYQKAKIERLQHSVRLGQERMRERAAIAAWTSGMDENNKRLGLPYDCREMGSLCSKAIRALKVE